MQMARAFVSDGATGSTIEPGDVMVAAEPLRKPRSNVRALVGPAPPPPSEPFTAFAFSAPPSPEGPNPCA